MTQTYGLSRRGILLLAWTAGAQSWFRLYAGDAGFWNKKEPSTWSSEDISKLITNSPWAKQVIASAAYEGSPSGGGGRGGFSGSGVGGRRGGRGGQSPLEYRGVLRWASAKPMQEALKTPLPEAFANHFVLSLSGIPLLGERRQRAPDDDAGATVSKSATDDLLDRIRDLTYLEPKGKSPAQPGLVQRGSSKYADASTLLFGFSHEVLQLSLDDKDVTFTTEIGKLQVKAKFNLKDMMYREELAL
jgi:hypothetical protein